jgi:uncharacterized LabA/DUF88 family protein
MDHNEIRSFLESFEPRRERTIVIVDYGNVEKWKHSLHWRIGIKELAQLVKSFSTGKTYLRRFYFGSDYGPHERSEILVPFSRLIIEKAQMNRFEIVTKRVKYIHDANNLSGYEKKCDLDVEMAVDLIKERDGYDTIVLFSGDGDLMYAVKYLHDAFGKSCVVFGARDHIGREVFDAKTEGYVTNIFYAEAFEYRLSMDKQ